MMRPSLSSRLQGYISDLQLDRMQFGHPELIFKAVQQAEKLFKSFGHAQPSKQEAYAAALMLLKGKTLDARATHFVAAAVGMPIKEYAGKTLLESEYGDQLLDQYRRAIQQGKLSRLTWHVLLSSYFGFDPSRLKDPQGQKAFEKLRAFLGETWFLVNRSSPSSWIPDWQRVLREEPQLLGHRPMDRYAQDYLEGRHDHINNIALYLGVPPQSWFWEELVLGGIRHVAQGSDADFQAKLPVLIDLIKKAPVYRDQAIVILLERYYQSRDRSDHAILRDYVIRPEIWKNPKLKLSGIATAWHQVSDDVWRMVMGWVNKRNLRDFFEILASRGHADHGRLEFWSRYMEQITWTQLVIGDETFRLRNGQPALRDLLISEENTYARLSVGAKSLDAFLMQLGDYVFVEFSMKGNGAYGYHKSSLPFDLGSKYYDATTGNLKYGFGRSGKNFISIRHDKNWQYNTAQRLSEIGIYPDDPKDVLAKTTLFVRERSIETRSYIKRLPGSEDLSNQEMSLVTLQSRVSIDEVKMLAAQYAGVIVREEKDDLKYRIMVKDPNQNDQLANYLRQKGFNWSKFGQEWYLVQEPLPSVLKQVGEGQEFFRVLGAVQGLPGVQVKEAKAEARDGSGSKRVVFVRLLRTGDASLVSRLDHLGFKWSSERNCYFWIDE